MLLFKIGTKCGDSYEAAAWDENQARKLLKTFMPHQWISVIEEKGEALEKRITLFCYFPFGPEPVLQFDEKERIVWYR
jgi:hypothetical protein